MSDKPKAKRSNVRIVPVKGAANRRRLGAAAVMIKDDVSLPTPKDRYREGVKLALTDVGLTMKLSRQDYFDTLMELREDIDLMIEVVGQEIEEQGGD